MRMKKFFKTTFFKSLVIMFTTAFDVEFEVTDEFLLEIEDEVMKVKRPKKSRRLC